MALRSNGPGGSTGSVTSAVEKPAVESIFALRQHCVLNHRQWVTGEELHLVIVTWIERPYHRRWRQNLFGG